MNIDKNAIKRKLESGKCREHGERPIITVTSSGFSFKCCCEKYRSQLVAESSKLLADATKKAIEDSFKKAFK